MSPDEIVKQLQQIVSTLQKIVEGSADLAERVQALEQQSGEKVGLLTSLQGHLQVLLETYQKQVASQEATNRTILEALSALEARIDAIESSGSSPQPSGDRPN
jgi:cell division septum initiation protein DivIVA